MIFNTLLFFVYLRSESVRGENKKTDLPAGRQIVAITDNGFSPREISVPLNSEVIFINNASDSIWIASDNHPTHELYPAFDTRSPILPGKTWSFFPQKAGVWSYHNHLNPKQTGVLEVIGNIKETTMNISPQEAIRQNVDTWIKENGAVYAWKRLVETYESNTSLGLHDIAHFVGTVLYKEKNLKGLDSCTTTFAFGCYHGLLEEFITKEGVDSLQKVVTECKKYPHGIEITCYHGIGHGALTYYKYNLSDALSLCDSLLDSDNQIFCHKGVFMENAVAMSLNPPSFDPQWPCNTVDDSYKLPCYDYQMILLSPLYKNDIRQMAKACNKTENQTYIDRCITGIGFQIAQRSLGNTDNAIASCKQIANADDVTCLIAAAEEYVFQKQPYANAEYICKSVPESYLSDCQRRIEVQKELLIN